MSTAIETQDERDEQVAEAITNGRSLRAVRREFGLSQAELDAALERLWPVSTEARIRMIKHDVGCLQRLTQVFYEKAIAGCIQSGLLTVRIYERLHSLVGADAAQRIDFQVVRPPDAISSHEKIRRTIMEFAERQPPAQREAINMISKIGAERALELLKAGSGNGAAVLSDAVPPADDPGPT
jgi:hypothetical protein